MVYAETTNSMNQSTVQQGKCFSEDPEMCEKCGRPVAMFPPDAAVDGSSVKAEHAKPLLKVASSLWRNTAPKSPSRYCILITLIEWVNMFGQQGHIFF